MISADLHALMVRRCAGVGVGALLATTKLPPTTQAPDIPLDLGLKQLFQELAGEVRSGLRGSRPPLELLLYPV